jgi:hypothetical protein
MIGQTGIENVDHIGRVRRSRERFSSEDVDLLAKRSHGVT